MKTIKVDENAKLVEYFDDGHLRRVTLPLEDDDPLMGIPYGLPFAHILKKAGVCCQIATKLEDQFHKVGIWTLDDLYKNPKAAKGVFEAVYQADLNIVLNAARKWR